MFTDIFVRILQDKQLTPYKVAKGTGISQGLMSEYAKGKKIPSIKNLTLIANFLNVPIDTFACSDTDGAMEQVTISPLERLSPKERRAVEDIMEKKDLLRDYSELSEEDRKMIADIVNLFAERKRKK